MAEAMTTRCCIAGGGPAGMMLGFLLARAGIDVVVLEKYPDFFRDFRGDTIHPSTMTILDELGLLDEFLKLPHQEVRQLGAVIGGEEIRIADFTHLKVKCPFIALIPQWDFLNFIAAQAKAYPSFHLMLKTEATDLIEETGRVVGVRAKSHELDQAQQPLEIRAELVIAADGRHSTLRDRSGLIADSFGAPMDVLWFRLSRRPGDPAQALGRVDQGKMIIMLDRGNYWQCGFLIRKGDFEGIQQRGLDAFHRDLAAVAPFVSDRTVEITTWDQVKLLTVAVDRLRQWYKDGLLCIGDAAHAMSPIFGVGINLAIQDAVAAANILAPRFQTARVTIDDLKAFQERRESPTRKIQKLQMAIQDNVVNRVLGRPGRAKLPWTLRIARHLPFLTRIPARIVGLGFHPEHIAPEQRAASRPA
jgi:2-polyprenyl-6-methoxyphenol hydroxylase-like FAD-dependent oxidoreductase